MADEPIISRGFRGRRAPAARASRIPPGQYEERAFPVLSAGPTPRTPLTKWDFTLRGVDGASAKWTWDELQALPHETVWEGISVDTLIAEAAKRGVAIAPFIVAFSDGGYTTNLPTEDVTGGKA